MRQKHNGGFTLVELVIAMATGTLVFIAASALLLLGLRINNMTTGTTIRQNNTRIVMTVLERMATEGSIKRIEVDGDSWKIVNGEEESMFYYDSKEQAIFTGTDKETEIIFNYQNPIMDDVYASHIVLDDNKVLTIAVETADGSYQSSIYCRMAEMEPLGILDKPQLDNSTDAARNEFIDFLYSQYTLAGGGPNPGVILQDGISTGEFYSEWYITTQGGTWGKNGWNKDTPWCACYISYGLSQVSGKLRETPKFANVDEFMAYFEKKGSFTEADVNVTPSPGDIVFFDWTTGDNPSHVGVVLETKDGTVHTIEGNSAGIVAIRSYGTNDKRIIGYGILPWVVTEGTS